MQNQTLRKAVLAIAAGALGLVSSNVLAETINLDADDKSMPVATYAKETLSSTAGNMLVGADKSIYYLVTAPNLPAPADDLNNNPAPSNWMVTSKVGFGAPAESTLVLRYDFDNMVLAENLDGAIAIDNEGNPPGTITAFSTLLGGDAGDNFVVYSAAVGTSLNSAQVLTLDLGGSVIAVSSSAAVNVRLSVTLRGFSDVVPPYAASYMSAVTVANALSVSSTAMSPTASVEQSFKQFTGGTPLMGNLGSVTLTAKPLSKAISNVPADGMGSNAGEPVANLGEILTAGVGVEVGEPASGTLYSVDGDFSFVKDASVLSHHR